jgi:hypothetical protein
MFAQRLVQRGAAFDVSLDVEHQLLHRRLVMARADDLEGLHQGNAGAQHGGELTTENRNVLGPDLAPGLEGLGLLADARSDHALAAQLVLECLLTLGNAAALDALTLFVHALPLVGHVLADRANRTGCLRHDYFPADDIIRSSRC